MPKADRAKSFWNVVKSVSVGAISREARIPVSLAVVGDEPGRAFVLSRLNPDDPLEMVHPSVRTFPSTSTEVGFPAEPGSFDFVIHGPGSVPDSGAPAPAFSIEELGGWDRLAERIVETRPDLALALAQRFPGLREVVSRRIIRETAVANAEFAMLNALPGVLPFLGILLPTAAVGDILMLAKNQAMMLFRLAAAHGLSLDLRARSRDLAPLLGNAFGWRAIAREVVAVVPGGVGLVAKGAVAYAGTMALGEAIRRLYALGQQPTRSQIAMLYKESYSEARNAVRGISQRITTRKRKSLPPAR